MHCVWLSYGRVPKDCTIMVRAKVASGKDQDTTCPHAGDAQRCSFVRGESEGRESQGLEGSS